MALFLLACQATLISSESNFGLPYQAHPGDSNPFLTIFGTDMHATESSYIFFRSACQPVNMVVRGWGLNPLLVAMSPQGPAKSLFSFLTQKLYIAVLLLVLCDLFG
jgi:hypothetical protein